ncbi:hypothetical protein JK359_33370 [Streptomyces actinomycinicus]|uniref:Uncharacterized protein n=1 Tax=Streptomyces actinomycinicus TaxID=1695166 RepID=A0A937ENX2_9ACTN|nr:hypothetical protein [Streptomyces actinomycinicus]MBL1086797.1 hypothetical protein [Streptomyces actinomycinicus]
MGIDPKRYPNPAAGYHRIACERRFMRIEPDSAAKLRDKWLKHPVACPICTVDTELVLVYEERADTFVQVLCPNGHEWPEPLIDTAYFAAYSQQRFYADPNPALLWIIDAGFGEESPPPIDDHVEQVVRAYQEAAKYAHRKAKTRVRRAVRKPMRKAKKKALNIAFAPVVAVLRTAWIMQSGGVPPQAPKGGGRRRRPEDGMKIPSVAAYRKALGVPAPEKGPACLVCEDSGRITAPGVSIPCTECKGAAAPLARAEEKARRVREGGNRVAAGRARKAAAPRARSRTNASKQGVTVRAGETVAGPVSVTGPTVVAAPKSTARKAGKVPRAAKSGRAAVEAAARAASRPGVTVVTGVVNVGNGRASGSVQEVHVSGSHQQVNVRNDGRAPSGGRPPTAAEAAVVRDAMKSADQAVRESGSRTSTTVNVSGKNNSVITTATDGDATHVSGGG